jgi:hypothetical protein
VSVADFMEGHKRLYIDVKKTMDVAKIELVSYSIFRQFLEKVIPANVGPYYSKLVLTASHSKGLFDAINKLLEILAELKRGNYCYLECNRESCVDVKEDGLTVWDTVLLNRKEHPHEKKIKLTIGYQLKQGVDDEPICIKNWSFVIQADLAQYAQCHALRYALYNVVQKSSSEAVEEELLPTSHFVGIIVDNKVHSEHGRLRGYHREISDIGLDSPGVQQAIEKFIQETPIKATPDTLPRPKGSGFRQMGSPLPALRYGDDDDASSSA